MKNLTFSEKHSVAGGNCRCLGTNARMDSYVEIERYTGGTRDACLQYCCEARQGQIGNQYVSLSFEFKGFREDCPAKKMRGRGETPVLNTASILFVRETKTC